MSWARARPRRLRNTRVPSGACSRIVPRARASAWPRHSVRTAPSSRRSPIPPIRCRSRRSTCLPFSTSAISHQRTGASFWRPMRVLIRGARRSFAAIRIACGRSRCRCRISAMPRRIARSTTCWPTSRAASGACQVITTEEARMKKLMNAPETLLQESLAGFCAAHAGIVTLGAEQKFVRRKTLKPGKVALISGGGSGHEPLHAGFVGLGMLDAACPGQVFTSPTPDQMIEAAEAVDTGAGVLFLVKNYEADVMNFTMAAEMAGREIVSVVTNDDVAVEKSTYTTGRRGVAGTLIVEKMIGAAAETGTPLAALKTLGDDVNRRTRSMGVALLPCTVPAAGRTNFTLAEDEMEMGVGIHGEPGRRREIGRAS